MKPKCFNGGVYRLFKPTLLLIVMLLSTTATAASSYLQELEAEAAATDDNASKKNAESKPAWSQQNAGTNHETIDKGLAKPQFEEALKAHFYGSYLFYSTLTDSKQKVVYGEYQKNNDIEHLREVIKAQMSN